MRIALVNWAPVQHGTAIGGGVNGYVSALARALHVRGHDVLCLSSGFAYQRDAANRINPNDPDRPGDCFVRERQSPEGVRLFEIVNSPIIAPAYYQFSDPHTELSSPTVERVFEHWVRTHAPDVVHFHNIEGLSAPCVARAKALGARVVFSLHNYHTLCPQVNLMRNSRIACTSFENGHACWNCAFSTRPGDEMRSRARAAERQDRPPRRISLRLFPARPNAGAAPNLTPELVPTLSPATFDRAQFESPEWQPLSNSAEPEPPDLRPLNAFGRRRAAMVQMLNTCDSVLAVSSFVHRKFESMGVAPRHLRTMFIGTLMTELAARTQRHPIAPQEPIRLLVLGQNLFIKGLPMTLDSLEMLTPEVLARFSIHIAMLGAFTHNSRLRALQPRLAALDITDGYSFRDIPSLAADAHAGLVPSVWWDNAPQTVLELLACGLPVIGPELGGIPDFVKHDINGLLYRGNDRTDLARTLARIARQPHVLNTLRDRVQTPKSLSEHGAELEAHYAELLSASRHALLAHDESRET